MCAFLHTAWQLTRRLHLSGNCALAGIGVFIVQKHGDLHKSVNEPYLLFNKPRGLRMYTGFKKYRIDAYF